MEDQPTRIHVSCISPSAIQIQPGSTRTDYDHPEPMGAYSGLSATTDWDVTDHPPSIPADRQSNNTTLKHIEIPHQGHLLKDGLISPKMCEVLEEYTCTTGKEVGNSSEVDGAQVGASQSETITGQISNPPRWENTSESPRIGDEGDCTACTLEQEENFLNASEEEQGQSTAVTPPDDASISELYASHDDYPSFDLKLSKWSEIVASDSEELALIGRTPKVDHRLSDTDAGPRGETFTDRVLNSQDSAHTGAGQTFVPSETTQDQPSQEKGRPRRKRKCTNLDGEVNVTCPSCRLTLRASDLGNHFKTEVHRLDLLSRRSRKASLDTSATERKELHCSSISSCSSSSSNSSSLTASCSKRSTGSTTSPSGSEHVQSRYQTYLRVKAEREQRHVAGRRKKNGEEETTCPVCNKKIIGTPHELTEHVDECLRKESEDVDVDGEDVDVEFEEYTWAGQTRIRATTLLQGGLAASGFQTGTKPGSEDADGEADLNVDEDDEDLYGKAQYTEADVIPCMSDEPSEERARKALRSAFLSSETTQRIQPHFRELSAESSSHSPGSLEQVEDAAASSTSSTSSTSAASRPTVSDKDNLLQVIDCLKVKVKEQEKLLSEGDNVKCLICMEPYTNPLTSIQCWHVYCEVCWLKTLGAKKLCPQCNMITSPVDLRKIYL